MLRESITATNSQVNMQSIISGVDSLLPHGDLLLQLPGALLGKDGDVLQQLRDQLITVISAEFAAAAVAVVANFQMMNRLLDATGIPVQRRFMAIAEELDVAADQ